jgi:hypothetical protein
MHRIYVEGTIFAICGADIKPIKPCKLNRSLEIVRAEWLSKYFRIKIKFSINKGRICRSNNRYFNIIACIIKIAYSIAICKNLVGLREF